MTHWKDMSPEERARLTAERQAERVEQEGRLKKRVQADLIRAYEDRLTQEIDRMSETEYERLRVASWMMDLTPVEMLAWEADGMNLRGMRERLT